ncbi:ABC-2 transporter permease [Clostridium sp. AF19-22AC]|jgi:ABC-2 type transport system permease protein|uniref:ABC-2 transporter permease n=1 Tax=Clostridia TaxID=186801 RepID=UPI000E50A54C|nr:MULTISPECIES: ABC-2 transporter permease [Clostridia]RHR29518.1 ABC-2 transporter permease [Clostridium sp. AF19-22AC]
MKGLLIKDLKLLKNQMNFFLIICVVGMMLMITQKNPMIMVSYSTFLFSMFTLSTISYDEFDNSNAFLFTLPITRKLYVVEKYVFGILTALGAWFASTVIAAVYTALRQPGTNQTEWIITAAIMLCLPAVFLALTIPVQLKFGADKGRAAMIGVVGGIFILCFAASYVMKSMGINIDDISNIITNMGARGLAFTVAAICIAACVVSYFISLRIMEKKQF